MFNINYQIDKANKLFEKKKYIEATDDLLNIIEKFPSNERAKKLLKKIIIINNNYKPRKNELETLQKFIHKKDFKNLISFATELSKKYPNYFLIYNLIGYGFESLKDYVRAITNYKIAIKLKTDFHEGYFNIGNCFFELSDFKNAQYFFEKAILYKNDYAISFNNLGLTHRELGNYSVAIHNFKKAIFYNKYFYEAYNNLGNIYMDLNQSDKALNYYKQSFELNPDYNDCINNIAISLENKGNINEAITFFKKIDNITVNNSEIIKNLSLNQLSSFNFHEGWKNYKHRFFSKGFQIDKNILKIPEFSLNKKFDNVFVWPEQGLGDQILFSRFLNNLNLHGIKIYSLVHKKLDPVFKKSFPNINFVDHVNYNSFKSQVALGDLGNLFINNLDDVIDSSSKYLKANYKKSIKFRSMLPKNTLLCGLSWETKSLFNASMVEQNHKKNYLSLKLENLSKILKLPNVRFIDLQYTDTSKERREILDELGIDIIKLSEVDTLNNIEDVVSLIDICDFIISVSNINAHIAGSLGKKTYLILPTGRGKIWYWSKYKNSSAWYKSVKVLEQNTPANWDGVIDNLYEKIISDFKNIK